MVLREDPVDPSSRGPWFLSYPSSQIPGPTSFLGWAQKHKIEDSVYSGWQVGWLAGGNTGWLAAVWQAGWQVGRRSGRPKSKIPGFSLHRLETSRSRATGFPKGGGNCLAAKTSPGRLLGRTWG